MKNSIVILLLVLTKLCLADYSHTRSVDDYDQDTGLFFTLLQSSGGQGALSSKSAININLFIYDPVSKVGRNLFQHNTNQITGVLIPSGLNEKNQVRFMAYSVDIKNNHGISSQIIKEKILVETYDQQSKTYKVWVSSKKESKPQALFSYQKPASWHYDVKADLVRVLSPDNHSMKVNEYMW